MRWALASWADVRNKAVRLRNSGRVTLTGMAPDISTAIVQGDHGIYRVAIWRQYSGNRGITMWDCECLWHRYCWGTTGPRRKFEGRMCSHALATFYEILSRERSKRKQSSKSASTDRPILIIRPDSLRPVRVEVEIADTISKIQVGLSGRSELAEDSGMVFLPPDPPVTWSFWMRGVHFPLVLILWGRKGRIIEVKQMEPCGGALCPSYSPSLPWFGAAELHPDLVRRHRISVGDLVSLVLPDG